MFRRGAGLVRRRFVRSVGGTAAGESFLRGMASGEKEAEEWIGRFQKGEPIQYITGRQPFLGLDIRCRAPVLIPRHDTEQWVAHLAAELYYRSSSNRKNRLLDVGTGSGAIALGLSSVMGSTWECSGFDYSDEAIALAEENLRAADGRVDPESVRLFVADILSPSLEEDLRAKGAPPPFDCVVMNPPYVPDKDWPDIAAECRDWEDKGAVVGTAAEPDPQGVGYHRRLVKLAEAGLLRPADADGTGGILAVEVRDAAQAQSVSELFVAPEDGGRWTDRRVLCGNNGAPRAILATLQEG
eukprot:Hpha_TRINITY_DN15186_c2_g4::TRINITY_DN15186_c2_g4_i1::g.128664::m.128664/K02493/hemK, prmC, HEMK; release factor glutamine methyltransferase